MTEPTFSMVACSAVDSNVCRDHIAVFCSKETVNVCDFYVTLR